MVVAAAPALGVTVLDRFAARCCCTIVGGAGAVSPKALRELLYRLSMEARSPDMTGLIPSAAPAAEPAPAPPGLPALPPPAAVLVADAAGDVSISPTSCRARDDWVGPSGAGAVEPYGEKELAYLAAMDARSPDTTGRGTSFVDEADGGVGLAVLEAAAWFGCATNGGRLSALPLVR